MLLNLGFSLTLLAFICVSYGAVAAFVAAFCRHSRLLSSSLHALGCATVLMAGASGVLLYGFIQHDYMIKYVFEHSSNDLPILYMLTAFWSSLEGSHMLWALLLSVVAWVASVTVRGDNIPLKPYILGVQQLVLMFMFSALFTHSDPFVLNLAGGSDGAGLNALLQNPYMASHPPLLFLGYALLLPPFAYGVAGLLYGEITGALCAVVRGFTLVAFVVLTLAIALGARWAYEVLGWAGYWEWDPVENASLVPWLLVTALLHVLAVYRRTRHLQKTMVVLAAVSFITCFFGSFLTRSGVISSVHSFAKSATGVYYLGFVGVLLLGFLLLYAGRSGAFMPRSRPRAALVEAHLTMLAMFLFSAFAAVVLVGMVFPIISEVLTGARVSVQAPYYNRCAPYVAALLLILMLVRRGAVVHLKLKPWGSLLAHLGAVLTIVGFCGNYFNASARVTLQPGKRVDALGYQLTLQEGVTAHVKDNATLYAARVELLQNGAHVATLNPAQAIYPTGERNALTVVAVVSALWRDYYLVLDEWDQKNSSGPVTLTLHLNPLVMWVWIGVMLMAIGGAFTWFGLVSTRRHRRTQEARRPAAPSTTSSEQRGDTASAADGIGP